MTSEIGDPFDGASPGVFHMQDNYDDLLGVEIPIEDLDLSMADFEGEQAQIFHTTPVANMSSLQDQSLETAKEPEDVGSTADIMIKKEPLDEDFTSAIPINTVDDPIELSDSEDEDVLIQQPDGSMVPIKKEDDEVEFLWEKMGDYVIDLDSDHDTSAASRPNLGKSFLRGLGPRGRRPGLDRSAALRAQEAYLRDIRRKRGIPEPSATRGTLGGLANHSSKRPEHAVEDDDSNWMNTQYISDEDNDKGVAFRALKKGYNIKVKTNSNTVIDDIELKKAEKKEKLRLAKVDAEYRNARGYSDNDESDDGLFVSPNEETPNPGSRVARQRKPNSDGNNKSQQRLDQEQEMNMMAGIEEFMRKASIEEGEKPGKKGKRKSGKGGRKDGPKRSRRNKAGRLNDVNDLLTSNVYEDADANLNREALSVSGHTNKDKALAALVASIPLGTTQKDIVAEKNLIKKATVTLARNIRGYCKPDGENNNNWKLPGMTSSLRHHQVLGAAFCVERETGGEEPLGGILADAMGLGKTVMMLALLTANPPPRDEKYRATLIVCTPGLLVQWEREIEKHTEPGHLDLVLKHHSHTRVSGKAAIRVMEQQDIILTTYQEVVKSYPKFEMPDNIRSGDDVQAWWEKQWDQKRDVLHQARFYRVVLDESQVIKNYKSQTSIACRALMAKHKWACSATPIMNSVDELYPYFKFLRIPHTGSFTEFQDKYSKAGSDDCNARLHCLLDQVLCRRTFKDTLLGAPIVKLPKHNQRTVNIEFSPVENVLYQRVFKKFVGILNKASAEGKLEKHPGLGLVAFLRLRQMCAHTFLVQEVLEELLDLESIDNIEQAFISGATQENKDDRDLLAALRRMVEAKPEVVDAPEEPQHEQVQLGGLANKFGRFLKSLKAKSSWSELKARIVCQLCGDPPESAIVTSCLHVYCQECLEGLATQASEKDQDQTACRKCGEIFSAAESCEGLKELEWDDKLLIGGISGRRKGPKKINMDWVFYDNNLVMSTKIIAVRTQVEKWLEEEKDKKIIIFSQFHMIMQILERMCQKQNWKYCNYNGKMSHDARDKAIAEFGKDDTKIMIASLKCGGIGLNLTMASRVVCIDLWFNGCVEQQAFCRVFRIGQEFETFITRFVVNSSADVKLMDMQLRKNALISQAMDDRSVMSKLTTHDILRLFGEVRLDKDQRPFVHLDDDEKLDSLFEKRGQK